MRRDQPKTPEPVRSTLPNPDQPHASPTRSTTDIGLRERFSQQSRELELAPQHVLARRATFSFFFTAFTLRGKLLAGFVDTPAYSCACTRYSTLLILSSWMYLASDSFLGGCRLPPWLGPSSRAPVLSVVGALRADAPGRLLTSRRVASVGLLVPTFSCGLEYVEEFFRGIVFAALASPLWAAYIVCRACLRGRLPATTEHSTESRAAHTRTTCAV